MSFQKFSYSATKKKERTHEVVGKILSVEVSTITTKNGEVPKYSMQVQTTDGIMNLNTLKGSIKGNSTPNLMIGATAQFLGEVAEATNAQGEKYSVFNTLECNVQMSKLAQVAAAGVVLAASADLFD